MEYEGMGGDILLRFLYLNLHDDIVVSELNQTNA